MSDEWISIQTHSSVLCCVQWCRKIAQRRVFRRTFTFIAARSHFALFFHPRECGVHFRVVQLVRKQRSTLVLNICALFTRMAMTAERRDDFAARLIVIPISASAIMDTERQVLHSFDDNACTTKLEFNEAYSKSQLSIFSGRWFNNSSSTKPSLEVSRPIRHDLIEASLPISLDCSNYQP